jgi:flagellar hook-basal body complex protein FliE
VTIGPIAALPDLPSITPAGPVSTPNATGAAGGATAASDATGGGFSSALGNAIDSLNQAQNTASGDEAQAAAGRGTLASTMIAASEASLDTQVATSLIDKALSAYTSIVNMTF